MSQIVSPPRPSDRWIPWYFFGFFVVLVSVLVPMCLVAVRTDSGLVTEHAYEKGLAYNKSIEAGRSEKILNWTGDLSLTPRPEGRAFQADFLLKNAEGMPLDGAEVQLWMVRPTHEGYDQNVTLAPQSGGRYTAEVTLPLSGQWAARVSATAHNKNYQIEKRVVLP